MATTLDHVSQADVFINLEKPEGSIFEIFSEIERQSDFNFAYDKDKLKGVEHVKLKQGKQSLKSILDQLAKDHELVFKEINHVIHVRQVPKKVSVFKTENNTENREIKGVVKTPDGLTLPGANIKEVGTTNGVVTNNDGEFFFNLITANPKIEVSFIGYESQIVEIGSNSDYEIILQEDESALEEVVVVGFGEQKKISLVGSQSTIKPAELKLPVRDLTNSLGGRLAGLVSVQRSGEPGYDGSEIFIRGIATFGSSPRGPLLIVDGVPDRPIDNINPEDIESFTILKDASATAVYGARGANGVIIINTKSGQVGKPIINFEVRQAVTSFTQLPSFVDGPDFMRLYNEGLEMRGRNPQYSAEQIRMVETGEDPDLYPNVDWYDEIFNTHAQNRSVDINIRGGSEYAKYYVSAGYYSETGMFKAGNVETYNNRLTLDRYTFLTNVDVNLTKTTNIELGINGFIINSNYPGVGTGYLFDLASQNPPHIAPPQYSNGQWPRVPGGFENPYKALTQSGYATEYRNTIRSNLRLKQDLGFIMEGLRFTTMFSFDAYNWNNLNRTKSVQTYYANGRDEDGNLLTELVDQGSDVLGFEQSRGGNRKFYTESSLNYNRTFSSDHDVSAMLLYYQSDYINADAGDLVSSIPFRLRGVSGRSTYGFKSKYFFEANFGYSGSENFSPDSRFGFFPSFGTGWVISNESFFQPVKDLISHLKLRYTFGLTGNSNTSDRFLFQTRIDNGDGYTFGVPGNTRGYGGMQEGQVGSDVTWETGRRHNLGLEVNFFNDDLSFIIEFFQERRDGILMKLNDVPAASGYGSNTPYGNIGITENKGVDLTLNYNKHFGSNSLVNFLTFRGTMTYNKNKNVYDGLPEWQYPWLNRVGHRIDQRFGYIAEGLFIDEEDIANSAEQAGDVRPGDIKYKDLNGDGIINTYDQRAIGYGPVPQIMYGLNIGAGIKRFEVVLFFQGAGLVDFMYAGGQGTNPFYDGPTRGNLYDMALDRWTPENPSQDVFYPRLSTREDITTNYYGSTWWLFRSDYLRLKNAEIAYNFDMGKLQKFGMKNLRLYLNGTNLVTLSPWKIWDPELGDGRGTSYPNTTTFNVGLRASFQ
ncbi:TonB-dependent receptor [Algoriphagus sp. AGSA1]|uniref:SusC/RagA family TonB-linked outer membrane protein n=1 Tax=Algoriphagus sp. AGSA1 TaxID=2907213 RepID=UPI001F38155E|nr:TonB-dependent receptor [Algoriphagus sp. AGSA1]MCE7057543.1 TonB-dependent receptor [Algoriphagus sp. AGSA1]